MSRLRDGYGFITSDDHGSELLFFLGRISCCSRGGAIDVAVRLRHDALNHLECPIDTLGGDLMVRDHPHPRPSDA